MLRFLILFGLLGGQLLQAGSRTHTIVEMFGVNHGPQIVRYTETFAQPGVRLDTLGAQVNGQPVFFQRRALETHPDGSVKTGEWAFWLHLAARTGRAPDFKEPDPPAASRFKIDLTWGGDKAVSIPPFNQPGVEVKEEGAHVVISTGTARFKLPNNALGKTESGAQGPLAGFSHGSDPQWYGANNYIEGARAQSLKTEFLEKGPLATTAAVTITFDDNTTFRSVMTFVKDSPVMQIEDQTDTSGTWWIDLSSDMAPDTQFASPWFDWESPSQRGSYSEKPIRPWRRQDIRGGEWPNLNEFFRLDPKWHDYQYMKGPVAWYYNKAKQTEKQTAFAMFAWNMSRWHPTYNNRPRAITSDKPGTLMIRVPLVGGPHERTLPSANPSDPIPRIVRTRTAERSWAIAAFAVPDIRPAESFMEEAKQELLATLRQSILKKVGDDKRAMQRRAEGELRAAKQPTTPEAVQQKMTELGWPDKPDADIAADRFKENPAPEEKAIRALAERKASASSNAARNTSIRTLVTLSHLPVQKIRDWIVEWPDSDKNVDRGIYKSREDFARMQTEIKEGKSPLAQKFNAYVEEMNQTLTEETDPKGNKVQKVDRSFGRDWEVAQSVLNADLSKGPLFNYQVRGTMVASPGLIYSVSYADGALNPTTAPRGARLQMWSISLNNYHKETGMEGSNRQAALLGYIFSDPDFWPGRYYDWGIGNPNFHTDMYSIPGIAAAQIHTHPDANTWATFSYREMMADIGRSSWQPGGAWTESPGYTGHTFGVMLPLAHAFRRAGFGNLFEDRNFQTSVRYIMNLAAPFDRRLGKRGQISVGDSAADFSASDVLAQAAAGIAPTNPELASDLMSTYFATQKGGESGILPGKLQDFLMAIDLSIPLNPKWKLESQWYAGFGGILRSQFGTKTESLVAMKAGPARNHYQGDELSFVWYGSGDYLAVDYSSFYGPRMNPDFMHNKVTFGLTTHDPPARTMAFETHEAGDYMVAEHTVQNLSFMAHPYVSQRALWDYQSVTTAPKEVRRHLLLVKHPGGSKIADYLVIRDEIRGNVRDRLNQSALQRALTIVLEETLQSYRRDANYVPSMEEQLMGELRTELKRYGASDAAVQALMEGVSKLKRPPQEGNFSMEKDAGDLQVKLRELLEAGEFKFSHEPQFQAHLYVHDNPKISANRIDFKGQKGVDLALFVATGQDLSKGDLRASGWGHNIRPEGYPFSVNNNGEKIPFNWFGGRWHSFKHGFVIGRDVRLPDDNDPARASLPVWKFGEATQWLSLPFGGKDDMTTVLYPVTSGAPSPQFEALENGDAFRITVDGQSETVHVATGKPVKVVRNGKDLVIAAQIPDIGGEMPARFISRRTLEVKVDKEDDIPTPTAEEPVTDR
jgi:hypothetical protein